MYTNGRAQEPSARETVYAKLKEQILNLELAPGTALSEKESSLALGVSRTPVRESFVRLAQEGLVQVLPQRGTLVSLIDPALVEEARFMREHLERAVVRLACAHFPDSHLHALEDNLALQLKSIEREDDRRLFELDEAYHRILFEGCGKLGTWRAIGQMNVHLNRSRMLRLVADRHWRHLYEQHETIFRAVKEGDADRAERVMQEHLLLGVRDLAHLMDKYPQYFISGGDGKP